jgi:hypothetical protein
VLIQPQGGRVFRRIRTGHSRSADVDDVGAAAFVLAARQSFPDAIIEMVYLSDETTTPITLSTKKLETRKEKLETFLADIRRGKFPANPSSFVCPGCPAFFICGPTPSGTLPKKF